MQRPGLLPRLSAQHLQHVELVAVRGDWVDLVNETDCWSAGYHQTVKPTTINKRVTISGAVCALCGGFNLQPLMVFTMWTLNKKQAKLVLMQRYLMFKPTDMELTEPVG